MDKAAKYGHLKAMKELLDRIHQKPEEELILIKSLQGACSEKAKLNLGVCLLKTDNKDLRKEGENVLLELAKQDNREAQYELSKVTPSKEAAEWLTKAADKGHKQAQYDLGLHYLAKAVEDPRLVDWCFGEAEKYFSMAAKQGHDVAQCEVHWCKWTFGKEGPNWMRTAAFKGIPRSMYYYGRHLLDSSSEKDRTKGIGLLQKAAEKGENDAKYYLGTSLLKGTHHISKNEQEAVKLLREAARGGHKEAIYELGIYLVEHKEAEIIQDEGVKLLQDLADHNHTKAQFHLGMYFLKQKDPALQARGEALLRDAANLGSALAQYELGMHFLKGETIEEGKSLLHKFLETTSPSANRARRDEAKYELSLLETKEKDEATQKEGWTYLKDLAYQGYPKAQYIVGLEYLKSTEQEFQNAGLKLLENASSAGHIDAAYQRASWARAHGLRIPREPYFRIAANAGHTQAQYELAMELMGGWNWNWNRCTKVPMEIPLGYKKSLEDYQAEIKEKNKPGIEQLLKGRAECIQLLEKATAANYAPAQCWLGICYRDGWGVDRDPGKAVQLFQSSAKQNYGEAVFELANCYRDGIGVQKDPQQYSHFLEMAAELNYSQAQYELGKTLLDNNPAKAVDLLRKAVKNNYIYAHYELGKYLLTSQDSKEIKEQDSELIIEAEGLLNKLIDTLTYRNDPNRTEAAYVLGKHFLLSPDGDTRKKGFDLLLEAAYQNHLEACKLVSECYTKGKGTGVDDNKAQNWANKARSLESEGK